MSACRRQCQLAAAIISGYVVCSFCFVRASWPFIDSFVSFLFVSVLKIWTSKNPASGWGEQGSEKGFILSYFQGDPLPLLSLWFSTESGFTHGSSRPPLISLPSFPAYNASVAANHIPASGRNPRADIAVAGCCDVALVEVIVLLSEVARRLRILNT